jgi:tetratricopeptide (TPR) repeat protein
MEAATDRQLWSDASERDMKDVLTLQGALAHQIAAAASVRVSPDEKRELTLARVVNPEAYESYVRGRLLWSRQTDIRQAIREFEQAVAKDSRFAMAFAALADAHLQLSLATGLPTGRPYQKAKVAAQRALEIEPNLADAVNVLAEVAAYSWEWPEAVRLFQRALELNPSYAQAYHDYGFYLLSMGRVAEATEWAKKARLLDPLSVTFAADLAWMPYFLRQYDEAIRALKEVETMEPDSPLAAVYLALTFQQKGQFEQAIAAAKRALELDAENYPALSTLAFVYGKAGRRDEAKRILNDLQAEAARRPVPAFHFMMINLGLGDTEQALMWLERAYQERFYMLSIVNVMPEFDAVRAHPRFQRIVRQIGLSP